MARVVGPLFSVGASGTFRDAIEFRTVGNDTVAAGRRTPPATRTPAQRAQNARFGSAIQGWRDIPAPDRALWAEAATGTGRTGYQLYIAEYQRQAIVAPDQPALPSD